MLSLHLMFFFFPIISLSAPCEHIQNQENIQTIIEDIKEKAKIFSSVWCKGHVYYHSIPLDSKVYAILENSPDMGLEFENTHDFEIAFTCDKKNFYYIRFNDNTIKPKLSDIKILMGLENGGKIPQSQKMIEQPTPSPLLDKIKNLLEEKSKKLYQQSAGQISQQNYVFFNSAVYLKNGVPASVQISEDKTKIYYDTDINHPSLGMLYITPLNLVGRVGWGTEDAHTTTWGISLAEFLDLPGPFHLHHEEEFTILWHRASYFEDFLEKEVPLSLDIWIDKNGDIRRIDYVEYYGRIWGENEFQKSDYNGEINCMFPKWIEKSYFFNDYTTVKQGIRFPLSAKEEMYEIDTNNPEGLQFAINKKEGKYSREGFLINRCLIPSAISLYKEITIDSQSLLINELIPEEVFTPPPETPRDEKMHNKTSQFLHPPSAKFIIFLGIGIAFIFLLMYLTHRYLGWSFF